VPPATSSGDGAGTPVGHGSTRPLRQRTVAEILHRVDEAASSVHREIGNLVRGIVAPKGDAELTCGAQSLPTSTVPRDTTRSSPGPTQTQRKLTDADRPTNAIRFRSAFPAPFRCNTFVPRGRPASSGSGSGEMMDAPGRGPG
jgi:hypothetical protein